MRVIRYKNEKKNKIFFSSFKFDSLDGSEFGLIRDALSLYRIKLLLSNHSELASKCDIMLFRINNPVIRIQDPDSL